jgi:hypothetical protein
VPPVPDVAVPPPSPALTNAAATTGPIGQPRSVGLTILLTFLTLGIWALVWAFQNGKELKEYARSGLGGAGYLLITIFIAPVTMFLMASEVEQLYRRRGLEPPITTIWGLWFLVPIIGNIVWYVKIQGALNDYWTRVAVAPAA